MVAMEIINPETGEPDKVLTSKIVKTANEHGLLLLSAGIKGMSFALGSISNY